MFIESPPPESTSPLLNVEVAVVDAAKKIPALIPPTNVEVAVDVAKYAAAVGVDDAMMTPFVPKVASMLEVVAAKVRLPYIVVVAK